MSSLRGIENAKKRDMQKVDIKCSVCGENKTVCFGHYRKKIRNNPKGFICHKCSIDLWYSDPINSAKHAKAISNTYQNKSPEEKEAHAQHSRDMWANKTEEEKKKHAERSSKTMRYYWSNISPEEFERRRQQMIETLARWRETVTPEEKARISQLKSDAMKIAWSKKTPEELIKISNRTSMNSLRWWRDTPESEINKLKATLSEIASKWWKDITPEQYREWDQARVSGMQRYVENLSTLPSNTEGLFMNYLNKYQIDYKWHQYNEKEHPEFSKLFGNTKGTKSGYSSPYHQWDFKLNLKNNPILVDIDGSQHDPNKNDYILRDQDGSLANVGERTAFYDSKRPYQTDGLPAYAVLCYDDEITDDTVVLNINTNETITFRTFMNDILLDENLLNITNDELKAALKRISYS